MTREKFLLKITEKWHIKILSVAAAIIIAVFYRMNTLETKFLTVPLNIMTNDNLIPINSFEDTVRIRLRGEASSINSILENDIEAYIDLERYTEEGLFRIPVQIRKSGNALAVDPLEISVFPMEIRSMLEKKESRNIPVYPDFNGTIAQGYEMTSRSIVPANVLAEGPRGALENQFEFTTDTIDLDGRFEDFTVLVNIINNNPLITIHGDKMIEYSASVSRIQRQYGIQEYVSVLENDESANYPESSENGDDQE